MQPLVGILLSSEKKITFKFRFQRNSVIFITLIMVCHAAPQTFYQSGVPKFEAVDSIAVSVDTVGGIDSGLLPPPTRTYPADSVLRNVEAFSISFG